VIGRASTLGQRELREKVIHGTDGPLGGRTIRIGPQHLLEGAQLAVNQPLLQGFDIARIADESLRQLAGVSGGFVGHAWWATRAPVRIAPLKRFSSEVVACFANRPNLL
jgi:hypothetical protein